MLLAFYKVKFKYDFLRATVWVLINYYCRFYLLKSIFNLFYSVGHNPQSRRLQFNKSKNLK